MLHFALLQELLLSQHPHLPGGEEARGTCYDHPFGTICCWYIECQLLLFFYFSLLLILGPKQKFLKAFPLLVNYNMVSVRVQAENR